MPSNVLQISVVKLTAGDRFALWHTSTVNKAFPVVEINIVSSNPTLQEALDTSDVPKDQEQAVAVERLKAALEESEWIDSVEVEDFLLKVTFGSGTTDFDLFIDNNNAFGPDGDFVTPPTLNGISFVKVIDPSGLIIDEGNDPYNNFGPVLIPNIRIDKVTHQIVTFAGYTLRDTNVAANSDLVVESKIDFTSAIALTTGIDSIKFFFGWIEKDAKAYMLPNDYTIDVNNFKDFYQDSVTQFVVDTPASMGNSDMKHVQPKWGQTGYANLEDNGSNQFTLTYTHLIPFIPNEENFELDNYNIPDILDGGKSIKPIFQIDIITDRASNAPEQSTSRQDLNNFFDKGSIGFFNAVFQTGEKYFSITDSSFILNNGSNEVDVIDSTRDTLVSFTVEMDDQSTPFTVNDEVMFAIQDIDIATSEKAKSSTFIENQNRDFVTVNCTGTPSSSSVTDFSVGNRINNFKAEIDATDSWKVNCSATIPQLTVTGFYAMKAAVTRAGSLGFPTAQNLYLQNQVAESGADESVIAMDFWDTTAARTDFNFYLHWQTNESKLSGTFNEVKSFVEDHCAVKYRVVNSDSTNTLLQSFTSKIVGRDTGIIYEQYNFDIVNGSVFSRNWNLEQQFQNEVTFTPNYGFETGKDEYFINHAFQIDESWQGVEDMVIEWAAIYNQTLDDGTEVTFSTYRQSPDFQIGSKDQTKNSIDEPQALNPSGTVEFFDYTGGVIGDKVAKIIEDDSAKTLVRYTFEEDNLDDLKAIPATPLDYTFLRSSKKEGNLTGYLDLVPEGGTVNERWRFHNFEDNTPSFWESVTGHADQGYAKIQRLDIDTAIIEAVINGSKFKNEFDSIPNCYNFSARLDKVQTNPAVLDPDSDIYVIIDTGSFSGVTSAGTSEDRVNNWFLDYVRQTRAAGNDFVGNLYKIYPQTSTMSTTNAKYSNERWLGYTTCCLENEDNIDFANPLGFVGDIGDQAENRRYSYVSGITTCMRAIDINDNTYVDTNNLISNTLNYYYSSFFDNDGGTITHKEFFIDSFSRLNNSITFTGVSNRGVINLDTNYNVVKYQYTAAGGEAPVNPNYDKNLLTFQGINNDYTFDFGSGPEVITPSKKCLFIPFIDDTSGIIGGPQGDAQGYSVFNGNANLRGTFETTALNEIVAVAPDTVPTWTYEQDYTFYLNNLIPSLEKTGVIVYAPNGGASRTTNVACGLLGATHLQILRALKGANITFEEMKESTFLEHYDQNLIPSQIFNSLALLDADTGIGSGNNLQDNTPSTGFNNLENNGVTAVLNFGDYATGQGFIGNIDQDTFNSQITGAINELS